MRNPKDDSEGPIPLWQVLKEEYVSLHKGNSFPIEYLKLAFYKDHIKCPARFAKRIQNAKDDNKKNSILVQVRKGLPRASQSVLEDFVKNAPDDPSAKPPDSLQDEIVEQLNVLLDRHDLESSFDDNIKDQEKAADEYKQKLGVQDFALDTLKRNQLQYYNRLLLEAGFPEDIHEVNDTLSGVFAHLHKANYSALCISGGGIRSASFGLGVLQGLARHRMLGNFDYLSTVSGGGYLGSWLTAWIHRHPDKLEGVVRDIANLKPKSQSRPEPEPIRHLRDYSNYLSPKLGLLSADTWTLGATYIRNLILIWLVLIPLMAAVLMIPRICMAVIAEGTVETKTVPPEPQSSDPQIANQAAQSSENKPKEIKVFEATPFTFDWGLLEWMFGFGFFLAAAATAYTGLKRPSYGQQTTQKWFLILCLTPLLLSAVLFTTWWAMQPNTVAYHIFGMRLEKAGLAQFVIFGVLVHIAAVILWAIAWLIQSAWRKYKSKKQQTNPSEERGIKPLHRKRNKLFEGIIIILTGAVGGWLLWLIATKLFLFPQNNPGIYVVLASPIFVSLFLLTVVLFAGLSGRWTNDQDREWWARFGAWALIAAAVWGVLSLLVIFGPMWLSKGPEYVASLGGVSGLITLILGRSPKTDSEKKADGKTSRSSAVMDIALVLAAPLFAAFIVIVLSFLTTLLVSWLSDKLHYDESWLLRATSGSAEWHANVLRLSPHWYVIVITIVLVVSGLILGRAINTNKFSLHALYRNRLIRAYLGASNDRRNPNLFTGFDENDNIYMREIWPNKTDKKSDELPNKSDEERNKLFYVINMALNLVAGDKLAWQERKAASFTVSPLHAGNKDLEYRKTKDKSAAPGKQFYGGEKGISLGTAVTISGAAASPNMGYHSSTFVTFLLSLFNVRLGWWLGNTGKRGYKTYFLESPRLAVLPIVDETLGLTNDKNPYIYLSDGGHFENLGIYEMVLRRCRFILVSDASQDQSCAFEDLGNAVRKIRIDLGVMVELNDPICIYSRSEDKEQNEKGRYCAVGKIRYSCIDGTPESEDGVLIYIKPAFYGREPRDVYQYARKSRLFPHESTGDQFFSESQLESYRMLGSYIVDYILGDPPKWNIDSFNTTKNFSIFADYIRDKHLKPKPKPNLLKP